MSPETYIATNKNIFDYCIGKKIKGNGEFKERYVNKDRIFKEDSIQPTIRYYISNKGSKIFKCNKSDSREIQVESGKWLISIMNDHKVLKWEDYGINDQYYIQAIYREIENVAGPALQQLTLF